VYKTYNKEMPNEFRYCKDLANRGLCRKLPLRFKTLEWISSPKKHCDKVKTVTCKRQCQVEIAVKRMPTIKQLPDKGHDRENTDGLCHREKKCDATGEEQSALKKRKDKTARQCKE